MERGENIIGSGAKRMRHGTYRSVYRDNRGGGAMYYRGEVQTCDARGVTRIRRWFRTYEEAMNWIGKH